MLFCWRNICFAAHLNQMTLLLIINRWENQLHLHINRNSYSFLCMTIINILISDVPCDRCCLVRHLNRFCSGSENHSTKSLAGIFVYFCFIRNTTIFEFRLFLAFDLNFEQNTIFTVKLIMIIEYFCLNAIKTHNNNNIHVMKPHSNTLH